MEEAVEEVGFALTAQRIIGEKIGATRGGNQKDKDVGSSLEEEVVDMDPRGAGGVG